MSQSLNDDLQRQLMVLFVAEAQEHVQTINQNLLALEAKPPKDTYAQLLTDTLREAHSLKGAARAVNLNDVETLAHHLESLFVGLQNGGKLLSAEGFDLAYKSLDAIGALVQEATGAETAAVNVRALISKLNKLLEAVHAMKAEPPAKDAPKKTAKKKSGKPAKGSGEESSSSPFPAAPDEPVNAPTDSSEKKDTDVKKEKPAAPKAESGKKSRTGAAEKSSGQVALKDTSASAVTLAAEEQPAVPVVDGLKQEETVRLTTAKLDTLLSLMGELQVTRIGSGQSLVELQELRESVAAWEAEWRKVRPSFRRFLVSADTEIFQSDVDPLEGMNGSLKSSAVQPVMDFLQSNEVHLRNLREQVNNLVRVSQADGHRMDQVASEMEEEIRQTRMLPISTVFNTFPRMVRDLARDKGKEVSLVIQGGETDVDRSVLEQIKDPLLHLIRNCIDHGIEAPDVRVKAGKASQGTIGLKASHQGDSLVIEIADDGAGIDLDNVRRIAIKKRLLTEEAANVLSDHDVLWLIFHSGFSTSPIITDLSGRGVGLDVVRQRVEHLHGLIDVDNHPGQGVRFILSVPLTVATTLCLLAQSGGWKMGAAYQHHTFAIPIVNVVRLIRVCQEDIGFVEGRQVVSLDGEPVTLWRLSDILGLEAYPHEENEDRRPAIVVGSAEKRMAFLVDVVVGTQEMVIKSLPRPLLRVRNSAGASILGTGTVVIVLNTADLLNSVEHRKPQMEGLLESPNKVEERMPVIMVADDSITTRTLEKNILEAAGYKVLSASDGLDAWAQMQTETCDLLVSDVVMPRMDGIGLTQKLRADDHYKHLPIILVTSLDLAQDRERGIQAGADAYIVKSAFDQEKLLDTIRRLI